MERSKQKSKISAREQLPDVPNEVYHSMKGFVKPRICKYSLKIEQVECGESHLGFITEGGHLYMMGSNEKGKLGIGNIELKDSEVPSLVENLVDHEIVSLSCGVNHTLALNKNGQVFAWGDDRYGALGLNKYDYLYAPYLIQYFINYQLKIRKISAGAYHSGFITENGDVFTCGSKAKNQDSGSLKYVQLPEKSIEIS